MTIPIEVICVFLTATVSLQLWTLREVVNLKTKVAVLEARLLGRAPSNASEKIELL